MNFIELLLIALGLSMDAFAVSICVGLSIPKATVKAALITGLYFGGFQAAMPVIGYLAAKLFADKIISYDHWIAFVFLCFIGGKMIKESFEKENCPDKENPAGLSGTREYPGTKNPGNKEMSLKPARMLPLALATSIDALAVGVSFVFLQVSIVPAASFIGIATLIISMAGVKIGKVFGKRFKSKAEFAGGIILMLIGLKILLEHLEIVKL